MGKPLAEQGSLPLQKPIDPASSELLLEHPIHISENLAAFKRGGPKGMPLDPTGDFYDGLRDIEIRQWTAGPKMIKNSGGSGDHLLCHWKDALISLLADCWENNPEVFAGTHGISLRPVFMGGIAHADKFNLELQPMKRGDGSVTFMYTSDLD